MANLTNSGKLISKIESIDSSISSINDKIGSIPEGTDIGQEMTDIKDSIGIVPAGSDVMSEIGAVDDKVDAVSDSIGTVPSGSTVMDEIESVDSDLQGYKTTVAETYATKSEIASVFDYKTTVTDFSDLPSTGNKKGDVYNVTNEFTLDGKKYPAGTNVAWNGTGRDPLGGTVDLSPFFNKNTDSSDNITEGSTHLFLTSAERTKLGNTSGVNTGDQSASDFDIKDLTDSTNLRATWSGKQDAIADLANIRSRAEGSIQATDATFASNTVAEGADGKLTVTSADNVTVATAESNNKSAIAAIAGAHDNLVDRVEAVEAATGSLPFEVKYINVTFNNGKTAQVTDSFITANTSVDTWVVTSGTATSYAYEYEVEAGKVTFTASNNESITMRVRLSKEISA